MDGPPGFRAVYQETFARLYERSAARRWRIAESDFAHMLERAIERRFAADIPNPAEIEIFLDSLHVDDLALAMACRAGNADAWREFDARYHGVIESFVRAIARDTNRAREIEASLYGDLFDAARAGNPRRSPLDHYHGRSAMAAWLRVVIVRREADWLRERYHTNAAIAAAAAEPVESGNHNHAAPVDPDRARFIPMLAEAMTRRSPNSIRAIDFASRIIMCKVSRLRKVAHSSANMNLPFRAIWHASVWQFGAGSRASSSVSIILATNKSPAALNLEPTIGRSISADRFRRQSNG